MNIEQELCKCLVNVFQDRLNGVEVRGNWIEDDGKGVDVYEGRKLEVKVGARRYESYTACIAEFQVVLDGTFDFCEDTDLSDTVEAYDRIMEVIDGWHADIESVKRDLSIDNLFVPVGLRLDGGDGLVIEEEEKTRNINQQFTIKGRLLK